MPSQPPSVMARALLALLAPLALTLGWAWAAPQAPAAVHPAPAAQPRTLLVGFSGGALRATGMGEAGAIPVGRVYGLPVSVVRVPPGETVREVARSLRRLPGVTFAEPNRRVRAAALRAVPNDPSFGAQHGLDDGGQGGGLLADADLDAPEGWAIAGLSGFPQNGGTPIGIIDSGIDLQHPEFARRIAACGHSLDGRGTPSSGCPDLLGHGTEVAGVAAATAGNGDATGNGRGIAGVSFDSPLLICRALDGSGYGTVADVAGCLVWLHDHGARVINMSVVGARGSAMVAAIRKAWEDGGPGGAVMVAAAGNTGRTGCQYPACYDHVVSVGATNYHDQHAAFSTTNPDVEVSAPGVNVLTTSPGRTYRPETGTSLASPAAAGVAAMAWSLHPHQPARRIRRALDQAVDDLGPTGRDPLFGFGRIDLCDAVDAACAYTPGHNGRSALTGEATDGAGSPLRAYVAVDGPAQATARATHSGVYAIGGLRAGTYAVVARAPGCQEEDRTVTIGAGEVSALRLRLACA